MARVLESARAAAESARRAENGAADTAVQAALTQKAADKILADRTDADACAKRAEAAALRAESYAPADGRVLSVNGKGGAVRLTAQRYYRHQGRSRQFNSYLFYYRHL